MSQPQPNPSNKLADRDTKLFAVQAASAAKKRQMIENYQDLLKNLNANPYLANARNTYETIFDEKNLKTTAKINALKTLLKDKAVLTTKDQQKIKREIAALKLTLL